MPAPVASAPSLPAVMRALRTKSLLRRADATPDAEATVMPLKLAILTCARVRASHEKKTGGRGVRGSLRGSGRIACCRWSRGDGGGVLVGFGGVRSH